VVPRTRGSQTSILLLLAFKSAPLPYACLHSASGFTSPPPHFYPSSLVTFTFSLASPVSQLRKVILLCCRQFGFCYFSEFPQALPPLFRDKEKTSSTWLRSLSGWNSAHAPLLRHSPERAPPPLLFSISQKLPMESGDHVEDQSP